MGFDRTECSPRGEADLSLPIVSEESAGEERRTLLSAILIVKNEAEHIVEAIEALRWADEILVVVDSASTDGTLELARACGGRVRALIHPFEGYAAQRNWSIEAASCPWIFMMDADERPSEALVASMRALLREGPPMDAYQIYRRNVMFGRELEHGGQANDRVTRFFRREMRYNDRLVHEEIIGEGPLGSLDGYLMHYTFRDWDQYMEKMHRYVVLGGQQAFRDGARAGLLTLLLRPMHRFLKQLLWRGGFLDGMPGILYACLASYSVFLKYAVLWDLQRRRPTLP
ncbi:MAG: glycosyltransferase family 2 protein [Acidobacteriota bacterium]